MCELQEFFPKEQSENVYSYVWVIQSETEPPIVDKEQCPDMTSIGAWAWQLFKNRQHLLESWLSKLGQEADKEYTRHIPRKGSSQGIQLLSVINHNNNPTTTLFQKLRCCMNYPIVLSDIFLCNFPTTFRACNEFISFI
jgi:hypothetical protein